jgi:hypothetical protein
MARPDMAALTAWSDQLAALADQTAASVVAVHVGRHESVSGTLWRPNVIVTAAHALRRSHDITLTLPDGSNVLASLAGADGSTSPSGTTVKRPPSSDALADWDGELVREPVTKAVSEIRTYGGTRSLNGVAGSFCGRAVPEMSGTNVPATVCE